MDHVHLFEVIDQYVNVIYVSIYIYTFSSLCVSNSFLSWCNGNVNYFMILLGRPYFASSNLLSVYCAAYKLSSWNMVCVATMNYAPIQELLKQGLEQKPGNSWFRCKTDTWRILQPPKYFIVTVNRFSCIDSCINETGFEISSSECYAMLC